MPKWGQLLLLLLHHLLVLLPLVLFPLPFLFLLLPLLLPLLNNSVDEAEWMRSPKGAIKQPREGSRMYYGYVRYIHYRGLLGYVRRRWRGVDAVVKALV